MPTGAATDAKDGIAIRLATAADAGACAAIYAPYVLTSIVSFEETAPDGAEMTRRIEAALVWLVAEVDGEIAGFAYGSRHRDRAAYRWAADVSVYLDARWHGRGIGRRLYETLFRLLASHGLRTLCAGITEPNAASTALHRSVGFERVGTYARIGWKAGAWHDVTWWQLHLANGDDAPAELR